MEQARMVGRLQEFEKMGGRGHVARQRVAKVRVEVRQARTIHHQVQRAGQAPAGLRVHAQPGLADVAFDDLDAIRDKIGKLLTQPLKQWVKYGRLLENFLEAAL